MNTTYVNPHHQSVLPLILLKRCPDEFLFLSPFHLFVGNGAHLQKIGKMEKIESENNLDVKSHTSKRRIR